jgi:hypothetical protein
LSPALLFLIQRALMSFLDWIGYAAQGTHRSVKESIKLTTLNRNELEYIAKSVVIAKGVANRVKLNQLDVSQGLKILVVNGFFDVLF